MRKSSFSKTFEPVTPNRETAPDLYARHNRAMEDLSLSDESVSVIIATDIGWSAPGAKVKTFFYLAIVVGLILFAYWYGGAF